MMTIQDDGDGVIMIITATSFFSSVENKEKNINVTAKMIKRRYESRRIYICFKSELPRLTCMQPGACNDHFFDIYAHLDFLPW